MKGSPVAGSCRVTTESAVYCAGTTLFRSVGPSREGGVLADQLQRRLVGDSEGGHVFTISDSITRSMM
jgi:hypothetical protein